MGKSCIMMLLQAAFIMLSYMKIILCHGLRISSMFVQCYLEYAVCGVVR